MPAGVVALFAERIAGQFEEHAGTADAVHEAGVAERQRRQRDGVGAGLQAECGGEGAGGGSRAARMREFSFLVPWVQSNLIG